MTGELDALLVRNLPDLNDAANRLDELDDEIGRAVDREIMAWISRNNWRGEGDFHGDGATWLAPPEWMVANDPDESAYLYFQVDESGAKRGNYWHLANYVVGGDQRLGFWLFTNIVGKASFKRAFRETDVASGLPMHGSEFFLPLAIDREALATALEDGALNTALEPIRNTLDCLPILVKQLRPLKDAMVAANAK